MAERETIKDVASDWAGLFTILRNDDLESNEHGQPIKRDGVTVITLRDGVPDDHPVHAAIKDAHGDMFPDDWKYSFISEALDSIADHDGDVESARDDIDADVYNWDRIQWLASHLSRPGYCDEAAEMFGGDDKLDIIEAIGRGQWYERTEVFDIMARAVEAEAEEREEALEDA